VKTRSAEAAIMSQRPFVEPIHFAVIEFTAPAALTLRVSDRYIPRSGDLEECVPMVQAWGTLDEPLNGIDGGGSPATFDLTLFNTMPVGGRDRLSDLLYSPLNPTGYVFEFAKVSVYRYDEELGPSAAERIGVFYLEDPTEMGERLFSLRMSDVTLVLDRQSPVTVITRDEFPEADAAAVGQTIPRLIGRLDQVPLRFLEAGQKGTLAVAIDDVMDVIEVRGGDTFTTLTFLVDSEIITATARNGSTFTGCVRGANGTASEHAVDVAVYEILPSYLAVLGEHDGRFTPSISNVKVDGAPLSALGVIEQDTAIPTAPGKRFIGARFTPADVVLFHTLPGAPSSVSVAVLTSGAVSEGTSSNVTRTVPASGAGDVAAGQTIRTLRCTVDTNAGTGAINWTLDRRQAGGPWRVLAGENNVLAQTVLVEVDDEQIYPGSGDDLIRLRLWGLQGASAASLKVTFTNYTIAYGTGGDADSTAGRVIGHVTCDMLGVRDDGTITGTPGELLDNPADATAYLLTRCYPSSALVELHERWSDTRAALAQLGLRWSALIGADGVPGFSDLRRLIALQSRCQLVSGFGTLWLRAIPDAPAVDQVIDYKRGVWEQQPAVTVRTSRTQVYTRVLVNARPDYAGDGGFRYVKRVEDLTQPGLTMPIETTLELPWIQDEVTAARLGAFWLSRWKRPRLTVELVAWQELLAIEHGDHISFTNHPVLAVHGGATRPFAIYRKSYRLADENPARIQVTAIEATA